MKKEFNILLSDRNKHIRDYLRRELAAEGYQVYGAKNGQEILKLILADAPIDILILDPELPYVNNLRILERLQLRKPSLPVIVHAFDVEEVNYLSPNFAVAIIEKKGNNIDRIKSVVAEMLGRS
ncbi:MAG: response regulator [Deltaproteobacteria bacterium]|nr:response regulator [Deltaproteobacteria bacterium]MBW2053766.1 response regulator [Deltaproteobacteria bacterium]MBW2142423.1 response regulator [Deltaproteobacteria bacterium]MBW2324183.1 response regulator [Deltaproteobacteria bacterium]